MVFGLFEKETIEVLCFGCKNACRPNIWMIWSTKEGFIAGPIEDDGAGDVTEQVAERGRRIAQRRGADFWDNYDNHRSFFGL